MLQQYHKWLGDVYHEQFHHNVDYDDLKLFEESTDTKDGIENHEK
jgi:hypothetical protein